MSDKAPEVSKLGMAWGLVILFVVLAFSGAISAFAQQLAQFFQIIKMYMGPILILIGSVWVFKAIRDKK